jgi:hypothetical protein
MLGRTPGNIIVVKPLKNGVIADFKVTEKMLNYIRGEDGQLPHRGCPNLETQSDGSATRDANPKISDRAAETGDTKEGPCHAGSRAGRRACGLPRQSSPDGNCASRSAELTAATIHLGEKRRCLATSSDTGRADFIGSAIVHHPRTRDFPSCGDRTGSLALSR